MTDIAELLEDFPEAGVRFERKDGLFYVYLDTPEALSLAPSFLPPAKRGVAPDGREVWVYREKRGVAEPLSATGFTGVREYTKRGEANARAATERSVMDAAKAEAVEGELDRIIDKRAAERRDEGTVEELWKESARVHNEQRREALGLAWREHHLRMREVHARLASEHERRAAGLLEAGEAGS